MKPLALPLLLLAPAIAGAQAAPTAIVQPYSGGINFPTPSGSFQYGLSAAEIFQTGYSSNGDVSEETALSGDIAFSNKSERAPLSLVYSGGIQFGNNSGASTSYFQSAAISQSYITRSWTFNISDVLSYLPQSPTLGLSGLPGTGDLGLSPVSTGLEPSQDILTIDTNRISNSVSGSAGRRFDPRTTLSVGGSYGVLHFFGNEDNLDSTQESANAALSRVLDARSSANISASYTNFSYGVGNGYSFVSRAINAGYQRQLRRTLSAYVSAGPLWINASESLAIPSRLSVGATLGLNYTKGYYTAGLGYTRGSNSGSGVEAGAISDNVAATVQRPFGPNWSVSATGGYYHSQGLSTATVPTTTALSGFLGNGSISGLFAGAQVTRRLSRSLSAYASYNALHQSLEDNLVAQNALRGLVQSFAIGISYFPRSVHLGQF